MFRTNPDGSERWVFEPVPFGYSSYGSHPGSGEFGADPGALSETTREQWEKVPGHPEWYRPKIPSSAATLSVFIETVRITQETSPDERVKLLKRSDLLAQNTVGLPNSDTGYRSDASDTGDLVYLDTITDGAGNAYNRYVDGNRKIHLEATNEVTVIAPTTVETTRDITIIGDPNEKAPFDPEVSDPAVLEAIENRTHLQWGDVSQFAKGGYNGLVNSLPILAGPVFGRIVKKVDLPRFDIDPRYGGAAIVGEQLAENLALEAAPALSRILGNALKSERVISVLKAPAFWAVGMGGFGSGIPKAGAIEGELSALGSELKSALPPASYEDPFPNLIDNSEFSSHPAIIDRLSRARQFDIGGYKSLTGTGEYGRPFDGLDSDEALQNVLVRYLKKIGRYDPLLVDNPATALTPELHRQIRNLKSADLLGKSAGQVLRLHIDQMRAFTPDFVLVVLEREALQFIESIGL